MPLHSVERDAQARCDGRGVARGKEVKDVELPRREYCQLGRAGQPEVDQCDIDSLSRGDGCRIAAGAGNPMDGNVGHALEDFGDDGCQQGMVLNDQDPEAYVAAAALHWKSAAKIGKLASLGLERDREAAGTADQQQQA